MKKLFLLSLLALVNISIAQKLKWNPSEEMETNQSFYVGTVNGKTYYVFSGNGGYYLIDNSSNFSLSKAVYIKASSSASEIFISNNKISVVEVIKDKNGFPPYKFTVENFDLKGNKLETLVLFEENEEKLDLWDLNKEMKKNIIDDYDSKKNKEVVLSSNKKYIGFHYITHRFYKNPRDKFVIFETDNFKQIKSIDLKSEINSKCYLLDNGDLITLQGDARDHLQDAPYIGTYDPIILTKYSLNGSDKKRLEIPLNFPDGQKRSGLFYKLSDDNKSFYVVINLAKYEPKKNNVNLSYFPSSAFQVNKINTEKFESPETKSIAINQTMIDEAGNKKKGGIPFLKTYDIQESGDDIVIFDGIREVFDDSKGYPIYEYKNILVFKESKTAPSVQKLFKVEFSKWHPEFSSITNKNDLFLIYNEGIEPRTEINILKLDSNLEIKSTIKEATWKAHKIYLDAGNIYKIGDNKFVLFGSMQKNVGSAILDVE